MHKCIKKGLISKAFRPQIQRISGTDKSPPLANSGQMIIQDHVESRAALADPRCYPYTTPHLVASMFREHCGSPWRKARQPVGEDKIHADLLACRQRADRGEAKGFLKMALATTQLTMGNHR